MSARETNAPVPVVNADTATFECVYPTCGGLCCQQGEPPVEPREQRKIAAVLPRVLPLLRPAARAHVEREGFLAPNLKEGLPTLPIVEDWCAFFNEGCTLHKLGMQEGDAWRYKPWRCVAFPLTREPDGRWHVRQHGYLDEAWDLFCLDPAESAKLARDTLRAETAFLARLARVERDESGR